jgi:hypothetical protein
VISHERSGTHFLMNALAKCYGYVVTPWINFDHWPVNLNFYAPRQVAQFFAQFKSHNLANIVKSHHSFAFFEKVVADVLADFTVFYIYRDPRDVMVSFWRFLHHWPWHEGPRVETCREFIRTAPCGQMMRYQYCQEETVLHRWRSHVDGWTLGVPAELRQRVILVRFEDLLGDYERVVRGFASVIGDQPARIERPSRDENVVLASKGEAGSYRGHFDQSDLAFFRSVAGATMDRLGYS